MDNVKLMDAVADTLATAFAPLLKRLDAFESAMKELREQQPVAIKGEPGPAGKDGADGKDGIAGVPGDAGQVGQKGDKGDIGLSGAPGKDGEAGNPGINGKDGREGVDGRHGKDGLDGRHGKDGVDGKDGKSISMEDVQSWLDASFAKWALASERRVYELGEKAVAGLPKAKDGKDGISAKDFTVLGRTLTLKLHDGTEVSADLSIPIYHGIYDPAVKYAAHDMVTFGGSVFIATTETTSKPGVDDTWRLAIKRGRDGRNP